MGTNVHVPFKLTTRNWINVGVVLAALLSVVAQRHGYAPLSDFGYDANTLRNVACAFAVGALWPGSPVGRVLDYYAAKADGNDDGTPPSAADVSAAIAVLRQPVQIPPTPRPVRVAAPLALMLLSLALALGGASMMMHGCGGTPLRTEAVVADVAGATLDTACQEMVGLRQIDIDHAATLEHPELGTGAVAAVHARYAVAVASCNLIADAHDAWIAELQRAVAAKLAGQPYTLDVAFAARVLASWPDVQAALYAVGVHLGEADKALTQFGLVSGPQSDLDAGIDGGAL